MSRIYKKKAGGARRDRLRMISPFTVGVAGADLSTASRVRIGCCNSYTSTSGEQNVDRCPITTSEVFEGEWVSWNGCEWVTSTPFT